MMATPAEIANDLEARARLLERTQIQDHGRAMRRAARTIRDLLAFKNELEAAAEAEASKLERYQAGDDLYG